MQSTFSTSPRTIIILNWSDVIIKLLTKATFPELVQSSLLLSLRGRQRTWDIKCIFLTKFWALLDLHCQMRWWSCFFSEGDAPAVCVCKWIKLKHVCQWRYGVGERRILSLLYHGLKTVILIVKILYVGRNSSTYLLLSIWDQRMLIGIQAYTSSHRFKKSSPRWMSIMTKITFPIIVFISLYIFLCESQSSFFPKSPRHA